MLSSALFSALGSATFYFTVYRNFFNQEIIGTQTTLPWAIVFGHPFDGSPPLPRHPVQLYESFFYFLLFSVLFTLWKRKKVEVGKGTLTGLFFLFTFLFRFFIEFVKMPNSMLLNADSPLLMGQYLSIPFILVGAFLLLFTMRNTQKN
jgi:prolipoprotein diacylglyceryltransferase